MRAGIEHSFQGFKAIGENGALIGPWNPWLHEPSDVCCLGKRGSIGDAHLLTLVTQSGNKHERDALVWLLLLDLGFALLLSSSRCSTGASPSDRKLLISNSAVPLFEREARHASVWLHSCSI